MTKIKATLLGIPQQRYEPQTHLLRCKKDKRVRYVEVFFFVLECKESFEQVKVSKYRYLPHPRYRKQIENQFNLKIPIFIRKLVWKLEEISC